MTLADLFLVVAIVAIAVVAAAVPRYRKAALIAVGVLLAFFGLKKTAEALLNRRRPPSDQHSPLPLPPVPIGPDTRRAKKASEAEWSTADAARDRGTIVRPAGPVDEDDLDRRLREKDR